MYDVGAMRLGQRRNHERYAEFAVASIRQWQPRMGRKRYPDARGDDQAHCGGSNGDASGCGRSSAGFADQTGPALNDHHYPPGTSKWNRIQHRLFRHINHTWRGRPLTITAVVELIAATTTEPAGNRERAGHRRYERGIKVSDAR